MNNWSKLFAIIRYEYLRIVKRKAFWLTTILVPLFFALVMFISAYTSSQTEQRVADFAESVENVAVIDQGGFLVPGLIVPPLQAYPDRDEAAVIEAVREGEIDGAIIYPTGFATGTEPVRVYAQDNSSVFGQSAFASQARILAEASARARIVEPGLAEVLSGQFVVESTIYDAAGNEDNFQVEDLIVPGVSLVVYFFVVFSSAQFLLQSVSEEKENRMIETILSMIEPRTLISGKIISLTLVALTQVLTWIGLILTISLIASQLSLLNFGAAAPGTLGVLDLEAISLAPVPLNIFFTVAGLLFLAAIMVGVGAVSTGYKDSQSLSSIFVVMSILPVYFITVLVDQPNGTIAQVTSYLPFTSAMIFVIRNSLGALTPLEMLIGVLLNLFYTVVAFVLATKLFELGALMYTKRPSLREVWQIFRPASVSP